DSLLHLRCIDERRNGNASVLRRSNRRSEEHHKRSRSLPAFDGQRIIIMVALFIDAVRRRISGRLLRVTDHHYLWRDRVVRRARILLPHFFFLLGRQYRRSRTIMSQSPSIVWESIV